MRNIIIKIFIFSLLSVLISVLFAPNLVVRADEVTPYYESVGKELESGAYFYGGSDLKTQEQWATFIGNLVSQFLIFIGVVFFILMVWGGTKYLLSKGDKDEAKKGLDIIKAGVIGLVIVALAYSISAVIIYLLSRGPN